MNKWIEQMAREHSAVYGDATDQAYAMRAAKAGAQAVLAKVKDIVEGTKANDTFYSVESWRQGRESLRQEILEKLNAD